MSKAIFIGSLMATAAFAQRPMPDSDIVGIAEEDMTTPVTPERTAVPDIALPTGNNLIANSRCGPNERGCPPVQNIKVVTQTVPCHEEHSTTVSTPTPVPYARYRNLTTYYGNDTDYGNKTHVVVNGASAQTYSVMALVGAGAIALAAGLA